jgi:hypothetical protein
MSKGRGIAVAGALLLVLGLDCRTASAQFASALDGTVTDPTGAVVPGASVTVANEATGVSQTVPTTSAGYYRFPALPGGVFTVRVSIQGFKDWVREEIRLESTQTRTVNVALEIGQAGSEEVTVVAEAPLIETSEGRVSGLIEGEQVQDLPLIGRNFYSLVVLTPGVTGAATGGGQAYAQSAADLYSNEYSVNMNANGASTESNNFLIDSATVSSSQRSGVVNVNPNAEQVEEVRVLVNNFSAEYGRNASVLVNVVTKSGTNDFHGSFGAYYTNDSLQSKDFFQKQSDDAEIPDYSRKEFTWGFGGPIVKDKTFFFISGDVLRSDVAVSGQHSVLTPEFIDFMQQARPNNVSTQIASTYRSSITPTTGFRTAGDLLGSGCSGSAAIDSPIGPVACDLPVTGVGLWNETSTRNGFQWTARIDHHFNDGRDRIFASFNRTTTDKVLFGAPTVYPDFTPPSPTSSLQLNTNWTKVISSNTVNELSFSWVRPYGELENPHPEVPGTNIPGIVGYQQNNLGGSGWGPNTFVQNSFAFSDVLTMTRGSHSLKAGVGYTREHADNDSAQAITRPVFGFASIFDFANDDPESQSQIAFDPRTGDIPSSIKRFHRTQSAALFVQDDWRVNPNLSLTLGLRYEGFLNITDASDDLMTNIEFQSETGNLRQDLETARMVQRQYYLDGGSWGGQHTLAPRVSFAWDPGGEGRTSFRGGVGRFYERMSNQIWDSEHQNLPGYGSTSVFRGEAVEPVFGLGDGTTVAPYGYPRPIGLVSGVNEHGGLLTGAASVVTVDGDIRAQYRDNWFLGVQRAFGRYVVAEANYIGSRGRNLYYRRDLNRFAGDLLDGRRDRILPGFTAINYTDATQQSRYHGATLSLKVNRSDIHLGAAYTIGKAIDQSQSGFSSNPQDAHGPIDQDEGPADFDVRHKLALSLNWRLPGPESGAARAILGGWQLGGVLIAQSGTPYTVFCGASLAGGCDYNADGNNNDRPNTPSFGDSRSGSDDDFVNGIFSASDFPAPAPGQTGNLGRNTFTGPSYFNVDVSLVKSFKVPLGSGEGDFQIRLESFNALNTVNLFNPNGNISSGTFGRSTGVLPGRIVQFSTRFAF